MNRNHPKILRNRKQSIARRLSPRQWSDPPRPMLKASHMHYEMAERVQAVSCGGIGAMQRLVPRRGLIEDLNQNLKLLKVHLPYRENDHVLNIAYHILAGGVRLEDIELRRQDENFLNGLGAQRIPDPATAGDFTRRFEEPDLLELQDCLNRARLEVWKVQPKGFLAEAFLDVDGTIAGTLGECKAGIGLSYKGIWGYAPLIVIEKEFNHQKLAGEDSAEIDYQPLKYGRKYRLVIVRKNRSVQKGEQALRDEIRYFFHITNRKDKAAKRGGLANGRCDQENVIEQLKNGVNAMRMPVRDLLSNWAYRVMTALAWNLKSWYGLLTPNRERGLELVRMEFRRFFQAILLIPCQVVRTARRMIHRVLGSNGWLKDFFATWERLQSLVLVE